MQLYTPVLQIAWHIACALLANNATMIADMWTDVVERCIYDDAK